MRGGPAGAGEVLRLSVYVKHAAPDAGFTMAEEDCANSQHNSWHVLGGDM